MLQEVLCSKQDHSSPLADWQTEVVSINKVIFVLIASLMFVAESFMLACAQKRLVLRILTVNGAY